MNHSLHFFENDTKTIQILVYLPGATNKKGAWGEVKKFLEKRYKNSKNKPVGGKVVVINKLLESLKIKNSSAIPGENSWEGVIIRKISKEKIF